MPQIVIELVRRRLAGQGDIGELLDKLKEPEEAAEYRCARARACVRGGGVVRACRACVTRTCIHLWHARLVSKPAGCASRPRSSTLTSRMWATRCVHAWLQQALPASMRFLLGLFIWPLEPWPTSRPLPPCPAGSRPLPRLGVIRRCWAPVELGCCEPRGLVGGCVACAKVLP